MAIEYEFLRGIHAATTKGNIQEAALLEDLYSQFLSLQRDGLITDLPKQDSTGYFQLDAIAYQVNDPRIDKMHTVIMSQSLHQGIDAATDKSGYNKTILRLLEEKYGQKIQDKPEENPEASKGITLGEFLKDERLSKKLSQSTLANQVGTCVATVSNAETNRHTLKPSNLVRVFEVLDIGVDEEFINEYTAFFEQKHENSLTKDSAESQLPIGESQQDPSSLEANTRKRLVDHIIKLRKAQNLSQEALGRKAGLSVSFVSRIEAGKRSMSDDSLKRLMTALGEENFEVK